jgi:hypothetical protein
MRFANDADDFFRVDNAFLDCLAETRHITRIFQAESVNVCAHWMPSLLKLVKLK